MHRTAPIPKNTAEGRGRGNGGGAVLPAEVAAHSARRDLAWRARIERQRRRAAVRRDGIRGALLPNRFVAHASTLLLRKTLVTNTGAATPNINSSKPASNEPTDRVVLA